MSKSNLDRAIRHIEAANAKRRAYRKEWFKRNVAKTNNWTAKRRAAEMQRTPVWADAAAIAAVYIEAEQMRQIGCDVQVDHIYPLRGKKVSGLHVHNNLQILLATDNQQKSNRFTP
jgi:hypothetical protein